MENDTLKAFMVGFAIGSIVSGYFGFNYGRRISNHASKPEFRLIIASVIVFVWSLAHLMSLAFGSVVDPWLNAIMGGIAGFLFGDGIMESVKKIKK